MIEPEERIFGYHLYPKDYYLTDDLKRIVFVNFKIKTLILKIGPVDIVAI